MVGDGSVFVDLLNTQTGGIGFVHKHRYTL
jgi:hypothetical protein